MSMSRRCDIWLANDGKWYLRLGKFEYAYDDYDCAIFGPFNTEKGLRMELNNHSNPGSEWYDPSGKENPPKNLAMSKCW